jgi:transposase-like protein
VSTKSVLGTTATGRRRNRAWPEALKREIVSASYAPGASVSTVAGLYDVNANQVFSWRKASDDWALIAHQQLRIAKLTRQLYGPRSERTSRLLDQAELQFEELESSATEDEIAAEMAVAKTTTVAAFTRKRPARKPFPEHLPRERVIVPGPATCLCCGGERLRKLGEDVTETLEVTGGHISPGLARQSLRIELCGRGILPNLGPAAREDVELGELR